MKNTTLSIGELAKQCDCKVETIHYYEKEGILLEPSRTAGGHRIYNTSDIKRLTFIRKCRYLNFTLEQIRDLLKFIDEPNHFCGEVKALAMQQYRVVQQQISELQNLQKALNKMIIKCKGEQYTIDDCPIIDALFS